MTEDSRTAARLVGSLRREGDKGAVRMEDVFATDCEDLWSALTDPARLARWVARVEGELKPGGAFQARFTSGWEGPGRVETCDRPRRLLVTMEPGSPDETVMEAVLTPEPAPDGPRTRLVVEERGLPLDELAGHGSGWQTHVEDLGTYLAGCEPGDWSARWKELTPAYEALAARLA